MSSYRRRYDKAVQQGINRFMQTQYLGWHRATHYFNQAAEIAKAAGDLPRQLMAEWSGARCSVRYLATHAGAWYAVHGSYGRTLKVCQEAATVPHLMLYALSCQVELLREWAAVIRARGTEHYEEAAAKEKEASIAEAALIQACREPLRTRRR